jgi:ribosomal subunit interface protein
MAAASSRREEFTVDIVVTGRHIDVPTRVRAHVQEKLAKAQKLCPKAIRIDVEISRERNPRMSEICDRVQLTCISRGPVIRAEARADTMIAAFDLAWAKLEARLRKSADRRRVHRGSRTPVSVAAATATLPAGRDDGAPAKVASSEGQPDPYAAKSNHVEALAGDAGEGPMLVREKLHRAAPMTLDQALYEMELVGHDFFLFHDKESGLPSVVYRRRGYDYGVIRLETDEGAIETFGGADAGQSAHQEQDLPLRSTM